MNFFMILFVVLLALKVEGRRKERMSQDNSPVNTWTKNPPPKRSFSARVSSLHFLYSLLLRCVVIQYSLDPNIRVPFVLKM